MPRRQPSLTLTPPSASTFASWQHLAAGSLFLAAKVEECPRKVRDVLNVFNHLEQKRTDAASIVPLDIYSQKYLTLKERLIRAEREILKELGFILYTEHPHKFILNYCKLLTLERDTPRLAQHAWNFINDSQRTNVCIKFAPEVTPASRVWDCHGACRPALAPGAYPAPRWHAQVICCAAIWMAARVLQLVLPPNWWELFDAAKDDMDAVCEQALTGFALGSPAAPAL